MDLNAIDSMAIAALRRDWDAAKMLADYLSENIFTKDKVTITSVKGISGQGSIDVMVFWKTAPEANDTQDASRRITQWLKNGGTLHIGPNVEKIDLYRIQPQSQTDDVVSGRQLEVLSGATPGQVYYDTIYCTNCDSETPHRCYDSGHERDSSGDWRTCMQCNWLWSGATGQYRNPVEEQHGLMTEEERRRRGLDVANRHPEVDLGENG